MKKDYIVVPPMDSKEKPGKMLKNIRLREGYTQNALAKAIDDTVDHIAAYEKGMLKIPKEKAEILAKVLHSVPDNFLEVE